MTISPKDNLTSSYFSAAHKLYSKEVRRRIVAYVESYDNVAFWRTLFEEFEDEEHYFQMTFPPAISLVRGRKVVLMNTLNTAELRKSLIACVDSDYDFLLQGAISILCRTNRNKYVFQTYVYATKNYHCYADNLHEVCIQATLNDRRFIDFNEFMKRYFRIAHPLFLWSVWFYRHHDTYTSSMSEFNGCVRLHDVSLRHPERSLEVVERLVTAKLSELSTRFPQRLKETDRLPAGLERFEVLPDTTYLFVQGHHIMDNVVMKVLIPVCMALRREREQEIKKLAEHNEQFHSELTYYQNSQVNVEVMFRKNSACKDLYLYQWLEEGIKELLYGTNSRKDK